jgi:hypothetical protein
MAVIAGIFLNGFSLRALKNCLWAFVGSVFGTIGLIIVERVFQYAGVRFLFGYGIDVGFEWYGFTLGLLLSQPLPQRKAERGIPSPV